MHPVLLILTGASGAGKTTIVAELQRRGRAGLRTHHFDSIGVPATEVMIAQYGSGEHWQEAMTRRWVDRLSQDPEGAAVMVLEGQMRPHIVQAAWPKVSEVMCRMALVDCTPEIRRARLVGPRGQPDLATGQMDSWAAYLRGQADALGLPVIDTSTLTPTDGADQVTALLDSFGHA